MEFGEEDVMHDQKMLLANAKLNVQRKRNSELAFLVQSHECDKGMLCPLRRCHLDWTYDGDDHCLKFEAPACRTSKAYGLPRTTIRVSLCDQGFKGFIQCSCVSTDCTALMLQQICNINRIQ